LAKNVGIGEKKQNPGAPRVGKDKYETDKFFVTIGYFVSGSSSHPKTFEV
jgi:hypothetical protein